ncbi:MAG: hypothetical protein WCW35_11250 [Bacteroidota bacterium]
MFRSIMILWCLTIVVVFLLADAQHKNKTNQSNFTGVWAGKMIQPDGPRGENGYSQYFQLSANGTFVRGIARIEIPGTPFFGEMYLSGKTVGDTLFFSEDSIRSQQARDEYWWCLKKGTLVLDTALMQLKGKWRSSDCPPGKIELHRIFSH